MLRIFFIHTFTVLCICSNLVLSQLYNAFANPYFCKSILEIEVESALLVFFQGHYNSVAMQVMKSQIVG